MTQIAESRFVSSMQRTLADASALVPAADRDEVARHALGQLLEDAKFLLGIKSAASSRPQVDALAPPELD